MGTLNALEPAVAIDPEAACKWLAGALETIAGELTDDATLRVHHRGPMLFAAMPLEGRAWRAWSVTEVEDVGRIGAWAARDEGRLELLRTICERTVPVDEITG